MIVEIPNRFTRDTMYHLLEQVIDTDLQPRDEFIGLDFNSLATFIEPAGVTILSNLIEWLRKKSVNVAIWYPPDDPGFSGHPLTYLDDSMFFKRYLGKNITKNPAKRDTTVPLELITMDSSFQWMDNFTLWLSRQLGINIESLANIKMCFGEIFNNIRDHAFENQGCIFAQHYPRKNTINIAISDFGVGIPANIKKLHPSLNDAEAILKAFEEGFTTQTTPRNLGVGLHTLYTNIVEDNKGSLHIHSNYGILNATYGYNGPNTECFLRNSFYPGTLIEINLRTDNIFEEETEEEFEW